MRPGGGKAKGSAFEREVCKVLSLFATAGKRDDVFWRSAMSGGRATVAKKKGKSLAHVAGDICAVHPEGEWFSSTYFIECKHYADLDFVQLLLKGTGTAAKFWAVAQQQASDHGKLPILVLKQNLYKPVVLVRGLTQLSFGRGKIASLPRLDATMLDFEQAFQVTKPRRKVE